MKRPEEFLEEARFYLGERDDASPGKVATADQLSAQSAEMIAELDQRRDDLRHREFLPDDEITWAFKLAAGEAIFDRLREPRGKMCPHLTDLTVPHVLDLTCGWAACKACVPFYARTIPPWSEDRCDVCGEVAEGNKFTPYVFNLGPAAANSNLCDRCVKFLWQDRADMPPRPHDV